MTINITSRIKYTPIKYALSYINIHRHVSVTFETMIRVVYKQTDSI